MGLNGLNAWRVAVVAVAAGVGVGAAAAAIKHAVPWQVGDLLPVGRTGDDPVPRAEVPETRHAFGTIGTGGTGSHEFTVKNTGDGPLTLRKGTTSCTCTVSDFDSDTGGSPDGTKVVPPGGDTRIRIQWKGRGAGGPFRQQATILTDDPRRPELAFVIEGTIVPTWRAAPETIVLSRITASTGVQAAADVFTYGKEPPTVTAITIDDPQAAQFFSLATSPLSAAAIAGETGATGGFRIDVDVKPGLPLGPLKKLIRVGFTMPEEMTAEVPLEGTVGGDLVMAGPGWDSSRQALLLGTVSGKVGLRTRVFLTAKGPHRESVRPKVRETVPESLQVTVGSGSSIGTGGVIRFPIDIVIPPDSRPANHICSRQGPAGRIVLETGHPESPEFSIPVCVAIGP
jgi:hypothetical protein